MSVVYEAVSDSEMQSFGYYRSSSVEHARSVLLAEEGIDAPADLRLIAREELHADDWGLSEPVTESGRYEAYSPSLDRVAWVYVAVKNGTNRVLKGRPAIACVETD